MLRPFGVFACIAPFNFPLALSAGMSSAALVAGNAVVYKPAEDTPWTGHKLYEVYRDAGVPAGVFNLLHGRGAIMGDRALASSGRGRRGVHRLEAGGDAHLPRVQRAVPEALPARDGREERDDRDAERRSRRGGGGRDALGVRAAEPEVQRDVAACTCTSA